MTDLAAFVPAIEKTVKHVAECQIRVMVNLDKYSNMQGDFMVCKN